MMGVVPILSLSGRWNMLAGGIRELRIPPRHLMIAQATRAVVGHSRPWWAWDATAERGG
jgi:hypothetical protein